MRNRNYVRITSEGFSFHTLELTYICDVFKFDAIKKRLKQVGKKDQFYPLPKYETDCFCCTAYSEHGIRFYLTRGTDSWTNIVKIVLNPRRLVEPQCSYLGIMLSDEKSLDEMEHCFTDIMRKINSPKSSELPECIDEWNLSRIDLCVNFQFDRKKLPQQLIRLLSCGCIPTGYERSCYSYPSEKDGSFVKLEKHSIKFSNKRIALTAYDKVYQCKYENLAKPDEMITHGILRLELQCTRDWIRDESKKHHRKSTREEIDYFSSHSQAYLRKYVDKLLLPGEYCREKILKERIQDAPCIRNGSKKRMIKLVRILRNGKTDVQGAVEELNEYLSDKQLRSLLEHFEQLNICPVPLDKHSKLKTIYSIPDILKMVGDDSLNLRLSTKKRKHCTICTE